MRDWLRPILQLSLPAAFLLLACWAEAPSWRRAIASGVATGMAVLSKFTTLIYLPVAVAIALAACYAVHRPNTARLRRLALDRAGPVRRCFGNRRNGDLGRIPVLLWVVAGLARLPQAPRTRVFQRRTQCRTPRADRTFGIPARYLP